NFNVSVKEHGAKALWALAGNTTTQQKYIAEKTSIPDICSMLLEDTKNCFKLDIEDIDFTTSLTTLSARWGGFAHPHLDVTYLFKAGSTPGASDIVSSKNVGKTLAHTETGLTLIQFQRYYVTISAVTSAGNVEVTSDGVIVVQQDAVLSGITIYDGQNCTMTADNGTVFKHHFEDNRLRCAEDMDYQSSTNSLEAYWEVPNTVSHYSPDAHFSIEEKSHIGAVWSTFREYEHIHKHHKAHVTDLNLKPGRTYRFAVKLCAITTCYAPLFSDGVLILANPPSKGQITVEHRNTTQSSGSNETIFVTMDEFYDPDIQDATDKYSVIDKYEWAITDQSDVGRTHTIWNEVKNVQKTQNKMQFEIGLLGEFDFSKCRRFSVRGYNKAKLFSTVSTDIKDCKAFDPILVKPNLVLDAVGELDTTRDGYGSPVFILENAIWPYPDKDYTPNMNYISAVWPQLRYTSYKVAVLNARSMDVTTYYLPTTNLSLPDPCSHPDALKCDTTKNEFINMKFDPGELVHGQRYMVCIHTEYTEIKHELWTQVLPQLDICSDGIVVDLTPPSPGEVWIGNVRGIKYQTSTTDMYINWETFLDVEEFQTGSHPSGIQNYVLGIGMRPMTGSMSRATTARATSRAKSAPGQRGKRSPNPSIVVSTPDNSRPSTAATVRIHPSSLFRPASATTPSRKGVRSPDPTFKTRLSSWKEEI
ncbi:uncharacterized protein LOC134231455, partial [Saccostrea cucullata]|uniref:uncharacterized protein LOC134231455 n=1 Tax=Saccostrea cuccullata TaxID=36930 RepID=UPI002ED482B6